MYRCAEHRGRQSQRGVALITVLLVFVLVAMMATHMLRTSYLAMHRTGNLIDSTQARYYALGAEELGGQMLAADFAAQAGTQRSDYLGQEWARENQSFEIEDGVLELQVVDQAGLFNLNSLVDSAARSDPPAVARFARLLAGSGLDESLAERVADWIDADGRTSRGGVEETAYGVESIANRPFVETSELLGIPGFDAEVWHVLREQVSALPGDTLLNLNTAPEPVLRAYAGMVSPAEMERFLLVRLVQPMKSLQDPLLATLFANVLDRVDVKSNFYLVRAHARYRGRHARLDTLMQRDARSGKIHVIGRNDAARL